MKRYSLLFFCLSMIMLCGSCGFPLSRGDDANAIDSIQIIRYDRVEARYLTTGDFAALQEMNTAYPTQTRALIEDLLELGTVNDVNINKNLLEFFQDSTLQNIIHSAESEFADMSDLDKGLKGAFRNLKEELPSVDIPLFYAQIGSLDQSIVVDDNAIGISLDKYLGRNYPAYLRFYDEGQRMTMSREYIVPDCVMFYLISRYGMRDFNEAPQHDRDAYIGIVMYVVNKSVGKSVYKGDYVDRVARYVRKNPAVTIRDLLEMADYSQL